MTHKKQPTNEFKEDSLAETHDPQKEEADIMLEQALEAYKQVYAPHTLSTRRKPHTDSEADAPQIGEPQSLKENDALDPIEENDALDPIEENEETLSPAFLAFLAHLRTLPAGATREEAYAPFPEQKRRIDALLGGSSDALGDPSDAIRPAPIPSPRRWITTLFVSLSLVLLVGLLAWVQYIRQTPSAPHERLARIDQPTPRDRLFGQPVPPVRPPDSIEKGAGTSVRMLYARKPIFLQGQYVTRKTVLREGDVVSFPFDIKQPRYVMIVSIDEKGEVSFYHPHQAKDDAISPRIQGKGVLPLAGSITLDGSKGRESIFVIASAKAFAAKEIRTQIQSRFQRGSDLFLFTPFPSSSDLKIISRFDILKR